MNKKELNIITLGDIFKNIENEEKAFKLLYYIKQLKQENKQLKERIDKIKELMDQDQCVEYCYTDVADYLLELEKGDGND